MQELKETPFGAREEAINKLITASKGSSVIANYIHVDRKILGISYKHALMITTKETEITDDGFVSIGWSETKLSSRDRIDVFRPAYHVCDLWLNGAFLLMKV